MHELKVLYDRTLQLICFVSSKLSLMREVGIVTRKAELNLKNNIIFLETKQDLG